MSERLSSDAPECAHWPGGTLQLRQGADQTLAYCCVCGWVDETPPAGLSSDVPR